MWIFGCHPTRGTSHGKCSLYQYILHPNILQVPVSVHLYMSNEIPGTEIIIHNFCQDISKRFYFDFRTTVNKNKNKKHLWQTSILIDFRCQILTLLFNLLHTIFTAQKTLEMSLLATKHQVKGININMDPI